MANQLQPQHIIFIIIIIALIVWWIISNRRERAKREGRRTRRYLDETGQWIEEELEGAYDTGADELRHLTNAFVNQGLINVEASGLDPSDIEGFNILQTNYNAQEYTIVPPGSPESRVKFVPYNKVSMEGTLGSCPGGAEGFTNVAGSGDGGTSVPEGLQGMSKTDIDSAMSRMDAAREMRDPRSCLPQQALGAMQYDGHDLGDLELYSAGRSVPTFGINFRLKGRNFENPNIRGDIVPGDFWDGWFQSRFSRSQYIHPGVLATSTQHDRVRDFEARRQRRVVQSGKDIIVV